MDISISVVIPTYNREYLLEKTLSSLLQQTLNKDEFEVIVIDDGGYDNSQRICQRFSQQLNVRYFWQPDKGFRAGKARNIGIVAAEAEVILFLDAGVLLHQEALARHIRVHKDSVFPAVCIGYVYGFEVEDTLLKDVDITSRADNVRALIHQLQSIGACDVRQAQYDEYGYNISAWPAPFDIFWTCHVSAEKKELIKAGLFDENFNCWGGEDVDLGVRLFQQNNRFTIDREICSVHCPHEKHTPDHHKESENAGKRIHQKYNLWQTAFYGCGLGEGKFSLNKVITSYIGQDGDENDAFIRKHLYRP